MRPAIENLQKQTRRMAAFALDGRPLTMLLKTTLFKYLPDALVARMRSAPPQTKFLERAIAHALAYLE